MFARLKGILFAVVLGLICPMVIIGFVKRNVNVPDTTTPEDTTKKQVAKNDSVFIDVLQENGSVAAMEINDYLTCVVLGEMPAAFENEALKAQAVVARTYTLRRQAMGGKHIDATVCTNSDCCQGYYDLASYLDNGGKQEDVDKVKTAVKMTDNLVLTYGGELIDATYFSCSGGMTEDARAVWGADVPYLRSVESPGEESAAHYVDTISFKTSEFLQSLGLDAKKSVKIGKITYTPGGGVDTIRVCNEEFKGTQLRQKLGLRSTAFVISVVGDTVTITTKGFGHRVGMSQYGADAMAVCGATFPEILAHYYQGVQLVTYDN